ncbi:hypothetical protein Golomagni_08403, partial [Golovinomyces magnicellulatus]
SPNTIKTRKRNALMPYPFYKKEAEYAPLGHANGSSDDVNSDGQLHDMHMASTKQVPWRNSWFQASGLLNAILITIFCIFGFSHYLGTTLLNAELRQCSTFSPVHDRIDLEIETKLLNGTFYPKSHGASVARQRPSDEVDAVWDEWGVARVLPITKADIVKMGKDPSVVAKLEDKDWGLGDDAYAATLDVFHQLHCVDTLRRIAYGTYYNQTQMSLKPTNQTRMEMHMNHCVDMLMQTIQCTGNVNLITMNWVELGKHPFPDM